MIKQWLSGAAIVLSVGVVSMALLVSTVGRMAAVLIAVALGLAVAFVLARRQARQDRAHAAAVGAKLLAGDRRADDDPVFAPIVQAARELSAEGKQTAQRLTELLDALDVALLVIDSDQHLSFFNRAAEQMFAFGRALVTGQRPTGLYRLPLMVSWLERALRERVSSVGRLTLPDDRMLQVQVIALSEWPAALVMARDISATARLEITRKDFIAGVSHELRTPLTSIRGYAETLLAEPETSGDLRERFLRTIVSNCDRLARLAEDLVTLSSIETGQYPFDFEPVEVSTVLESAVEVVRPIIASHHCTVTLDEIERARVRADRDALHRVMLNLLENAVVHGGDGIAIHLSGHPADGGYEITVRDTGRGIPSEHQARIFERFYRVDRGRSRERGGSGLGLALVKHIVHEHGGSVDVASTVGRGSTFRFWLPLANGGAPAATSQENGIVHD